MQIAKREVLRKGIGRSLTLDVCGLISRAFKRVAGRFRPGLDMGMS